MRNITFILFAALALSCNAQKSEFSPEALSEKLVTVDGGKMSFGEILEKYKGQTVLIEVWASWCGDCVKSMPKFKEVQAANPGAAYVFLSMDRAEDKWKAGIEKHNLKGDHFWATEGMKGAFGKAIDLDWIPRYIILDKEGKIVLYRAIETDFDKIDKTIKSLK